MKIAIAQLDFTVGNLSGNASKILESAFQAELEQADLLITPELALCGYPPEDLVFRTDFLIDCKTTLVTLAQSLGNIAVLVGHPWLEGDKIYNAASLLRHGKIECTYFKHILPNHTVFDEVRNFEVGTHPQLFELSGIEFGINICADIWEPLPAKLAADAGAEILLVLNASPFHLNKQSSRYDVVQARTLETGIPVIYANLVGGQDELVFDGASFAMNASGNLTHQFEVFEECLRYIVVENKSLIPSSFLPLPSIEACAYKALSIGVRDYVEKNHFPGVIIGLSGGIDSALTLAIAVDAIGAERVQTYMLPTQYTADMSFEDARHMTETLKVKHQEIEITPFFENFLSVLKPVFEGAPQDLTEENLQARIRGTLLMAISNKTGNIVLTTGNKSEMAVGYATLYGDMAGGFAVLKDVSKTLVYRLSHYRNSLSPVIPQRIIDRPPSAELRPDQTDQDTLPPYKVLDAIIQLYVEEDASEKEMIEAGFSEQDVCWVVRQINRSEYKRRQSPIGVRITERGFGKDRRYPITNHYKALKT